MSDSSALLSLPYLMPAQAQKHVTHNEAIRMLDVFVQLTVESFGATVPPVLPAEGEVHALGTGATGDWAGQDGRIAAYIDGEWMFFAPREGWRAFGRAEGELRVLQGGAWVVPAGALPDLDNLGGIGVGTTHDGTNRLAVASAATLFTHDGADHRLKLNKATAGDTASLLYQTGFSGRAEMGLTGSDDFAIRVSADGTAFTTALSCDRTTGRVSAPHGLTVTGTLTGTAVQQGATDATPGRVALAQHTVLRSAIAGPVSQAGGLPTGAIVERGSNANGEYVRHADGTQICWKRFTLTNQDINTAQGAAFVSGNLLAGNTTFPAAFIDVPACSYTVTQSGGMCLCQNGGPATATRFCTTLTAVRFVAATGVSLDVSAIAIGRWF